MSKELVIKILNREYYIEDEGDPLLLAALASFVENKMIQASEKNNIVDTSRIAVHAALSISKELFDQRTKLENFSLNQDKKINQLVDDLSKVIDS